MNGLRESACILISSHRFFLFERLQRYLKRNEIETLDTKKIFQNKNE
jgi:hypothetical protein